MTPDGLKQLIAMTGDGRREIARLLGYGSETSLRQCEDGRAALPEHKARWLESYAKLRAKQADALASWLKKNPPPNQNKS